MKVKRFSASVWLEGDSYVAQCLDVDIASYGDSEAEALENLTEAVTLHFMPPVATKTPKTTWIDVEISAA